MSDATLDRSWSRRSFVSAGAAGIAGITLATPSVCAATRARDVLNGFPHQDPKLVRDTVRYSHFDLDAVRELVTTRHELAKSSWDWGFGDWESALGAASHTGRREIAEVLISHGARPNLFTHTMMGNLRAVKAIIESQPGEQRIPGPHGITLLAHARNARFPPASSARTPRSRACSNHRSSQHSSGTSPSTRD